MARNNDRDRGVAKRAPKLNDRRPAKKKAPPVPEGTYIDYKDINLLRKYMTDRGKIRSRRVSGLSTQMQRDIALAIKTARELSLLPYATRTVQERGPRGGRRREQGDDSNKNTDISPAEAAAAEAEENFEEEGEE